MLPLQLAHEHDPSRRERTRAMTTSSPRWRDSSAVTRLAWRRARRDRRRGRELVLGLPRRSDRAAHREQDRIDLPATERGRRVAKYPVAIVPVHRPAARFGGGGESLAIEDRVGDRSEEHTSE